jgi:hypothetical protein
MLPYDLTQQTPRPISLHGLANPSAGHKSKPALRQIIWPYNKHGQ